MNIIKLKPNFKQYLWGGNNLNKIYNKCTPEPPVAESWEISAHPDGLSTAIGGEYDGLTIPELCKKYGKEFYGEGIGDGEDFPLLLKILDAEDNLSVQVHPDDAYANKYENGSKGKTEAWYILSAEEGAQLIYGFKEDISKDRFKTAIAEGNLDEILNKVDCFPGDVFYIPAGTVHAVGKGLMIAEIQQSSNTTYRVFDYNRRDKEGNLRELHIEKAIDVSNLYKSRGKEKVIGKTARIGKTVVTEFIDSDFFHFDELAICDEYVDNTNNLLQMVLVIDGELSINGTALRKGESALIPACIGEYRISGNGKLLRYWR